VEQEGLRVTQNTGGLPPANPKFTSPALGGWEPDYSKYEPGLASQVQRAVTKERAIYD
jgi:hypothetical protein